MLRNLFSLFPAYAGVILSAAIPRIWYESFPRIRGGDPIHEYHQMIATMLFPAYAGVIPCACPLRRSLLSFPRIRGGDPGMSLPASNVVNFSPHTRG